LFSQKIGVLTPAAPQTTRDLRHPTAGQGRVTGDGGTIRKDPAAGELYQQGSSG